MCSQLRITNRLGTCAVLSERCPEQSLGMLRIGGDGYVHTLLLCTQAAPCP
jgi:hypothetical protein